MKKIIIDESSTGFKALRLMLGNVPEDKMIRQSLAVFQALLEHTTDNTIQIVCPKTGEYLLMDLTENIRLPNAT